MSTKVALEHRTMYRFDRPVSIGPHLIRLRPAPHCRTPIESYSLSISPAEHFLHWQQDAFGNYVARAVFPDQAELLDIGVGLVADLQVINPFDFFLEPYAASYPFDYPTALADDLTPYLAPASQAPEAGTGPLFRDWLADHPLGREPTPTVGFLGSLNAAVNGDVAYSSRVEPGVQDPDETLGRGVGSCRDSAWLLVAALRHYGLAARFVSGYLIQLTPDASALDGASGSKEDFTDLHAWAEVFLPGAGWVGLDPTSALFAGEGHIPLAATPYPTGSAPVVGATSAAEVSFTFANTVRRFAQEPRPSRPYTTEQLDRVHALGELVDRRLAENEVDLTMGGEPTFVSMEDRTSPEWTVAADGPHKRELANRLAAALVAEFAPGGLVQWSQGRWYPGEDLPRWQIQIVWRSDGESVWGRPDLLADPLRAEESSAAAAVRAEALAEAVTTELGLPDDQLLPCYEDPLATLQGELQRPDGPPPEVDPLRPDLDLVRDLDVGTVPVAWALPLTPAWWGGGWASPRWRSRRGRIVLHPGELPAGQRLPLTSLSWRDPTYEGEASYLSAGPPPDAGTKPHAVVVNVADTPARTALVVQPRNGFVYLFLPPLQRVEKYLEIVRLICRVAALSDTPVVLEGYGPPPDPRIATLTVTPDPGVIEVNLQPSADWSELSRVTTRLYELAADVGLSAETFGLDGRHSGTGGGSHLTLGGPEPSRSPLLRRPDLLVSMLTFWQHHPSLSYLFSGRFVGPTSQAPRVDEGRPETLYELELAFAEIERMAENDARPWLVDRALRHLLTDSTGNTHRSEFCIDKLYSPDSLRGRLGLLELRGFEMPPHPSMSLTQALLVRALVARFLAQPYTAPLIRWGSRLHEQFLLPYFVGRDIAEVVADLRAYGLAFEQGWLDVFMEFRFPRIGTARMGDVELELRSAIEPWHVLGSEATSGGTTRYVDSSCERLQVQVSGFDETRYLLACNGAPVPVAATPTPGRYVAGIRYKAWNPWSALHPTLPVDSPLVFDVIDRASRLSLGGATYSVTHPGGVGYDQPPVNAKEAEARRAARFSTMGHTTGMIDVEALDAQQDWRVSGVDEYPVTLDLRHRLPRRWGRG